MKYYLLLVLCFFSSSVWAHAGHQTEHSTHHLLQSVLFHPTQWLDLLSLSICMALFTVIVLVAVYAKK
ncbi:MULTISPECIES: hypothetical protein [unclassified Photobacterium]|uniref:hypothetical protein n=1 Tax=unclassified Photobacterium TaxID=2628852 RepID=UPI001EDED706|nr:MULTISPECIES: hypothetical protein [unclassified Photobacterium]MCG3865266.1 hypothetical protein [Photobacterium sp. Ph6]MCG3876765.1 hypothetical protein [Photobacterium sp. Ph5]